MSIKDVQHYVELCLQGDKTLDQRLNIISQQEQKLLETMETLKKQIALLRFKKEYYENAKLKKDLDK